MKDHLRKQELLKKYLDNNCSYQELEELFNYLQSGEDISYDEVMNALWKKIGTERTLPKDKAESLIGKVLQEGNFQRCRPPKLFSWHRVAAAALTLIVVTGCLYLIFSKMGSQTSVLAQKIIPAYKNDIKPGSTKAIIQAGNMQVTLNQKDTSFMLAGNKVNINSGEVKVADIKPVEYTLIIPRGGEYSMVLADGTKVWLNADSKLVYPSIFNGTSRDVYLTGEGYFKVKTDANRPFIVHTEKQNIRVLGTEFNIQAYPDEKQSVTTLINGKVRVKSFGQNMILEQGQQAVSGDNGKLNLQADADLQEAIAWKEGYFRFDNTDIHQIMRQLSRWYNIKVNYDKNLQPHEFIAVISRNNNISQVLDMLKETGEIDFKIAENEVTVMP